MHHEIYDASVVASKYNHKLVHISHAISVDSPAADHTFGLTRNAVSLKRQVEIYQWVEIKSRKKRKLQNGETEVREVFDYQKKWVSNPVDSTNFRHPDPHDNPPTSMPFSSETFRAAGIKMGAYALSDAFTRQLTSTTPVPIREVANIPRGGHITGNFIIIAGNNRDSGAPQLTEGKRDLSNAIDKEIVSIDGEDKIMYIVKSNGKRYLNRQLALEEAASAPVSQQTSAVSGETEINDIRISFNEVRCETVSILGKLAGNILVPWPSKQGAGYDVALLVHGHEDARHMIQGAQDSNSVFMWFTRIGGWLLNLIGFSFITQIVTTTADLSLNWIPLLGPMALSIINLGVSVANFTMALSLSVTIAAIAWVFYRPFLGMSLLLASLGIFFAASQAGSKKASAKWV